MKNIANRVVEERRWCPRGQELVREADERPWYTSTNAASPHFIHKADRGAVWG